MNSHPHPAANQISINTQMFLTELISFLEMKAVSNKRKRGMQMFFVSVVLSVIVFWETDVAQTSRNCRSPYKPKMKCFYLRFHRFILTFKDLVVDIDSPLTDLTWHLKATAPGFLFCLFFLSLGCFICLLVCFLCLLEQTETLYYVQTTFQQALVLQYSDTNTTYLWGHLSSIISVKLSCRAVRRVSH